MSEPDKKIPTRTKRDDYIKYSGMATQMAFIIGVFVFAGVKLDEWLNSSPWFALLLSLSGVGIALYLFIKQAYSDN